MAEQRESKTGSENGTGVHARTRAHTQKFIPENRGCVSTSMAAGRSMHSPPPELTDAGRRGGQPLHARCHRNALSLKHRLIITDARPFSLSPSSAAIFTPPWAIPLGNPGCYNPLSVSHRIFLPSSPSFRLCQPLSLFLSRSRSHSLSLSLASAFPAAGTLSTFLVLSYLLAGSGRVRDDGDGGGGGGWKLDGGSFRPSGDVLARSDRWTASCMTGWVVENAFGLKCLGEQE